MELNKEDTNNPWVTLNETEVYDNPWIRVAHREVLTPAGNPGIYGVVHFKNVAVGVVPIDAQGYTWLVGQYRFPINRYSWEIPEGGCPIGTDPLDSAKRELQEETGLVANQWIKLLEFALSNSVSDEVGVIYMATDLTQGSAAPEETEVLQVQHLPFQEALRLIDSGVITDAMSIMGLQAVARLDRIP